MKAYKILIFIVVILVFLTLIASFFPSQGVQIGNLSLRFPSIEKILTRSNTLDVPEIEVEIPEISYKDSLLFSLQDSVTFYQVLVENELGKFYFPDDDVHFFDHFFIMAEQAKTEQKVVRILHYGDSQIELDRISQNIRRWFQEKFGGGGPGLLPPVQYIPRASIYQSKEGDYTLYSVFGDGLRRSDKEYGILSKSYEMNGSNSFFVRTTEKSSEHYFSIVRVLFKDKRGDFAATLKDRKNEHKKFFNSEEMGLQSCIWRLDTPSNSLSLSFSGYADIYGIFVDRDYGVNVDNIPIRGSSGTFFTQISDSLLKYSFKESNVGLIILQFGGNSVPYLSSNQSIEAYTEKVERQIKYLKRLSPQSKILFIGPSDMSQRKEGILQSYPNLSKVVLALRETVTRSGAAYWDMFEVMGGENSMIAWVNHGLAGSDYIHFTTKGAEKIGNILTNSLEYTYQLYLSNQKLQEEILDLN